jgi:hypothetical protein
MTFSSGPSESVASAKERTQERRGDDYAKPLLQGKGENKFLTDFDRAPEGRGKTVEAHRAARQYFAPKPSGRISIPWGLFEHHWLPR